MPSHPPKKAPAHVVPERKNTGMIVVIAVAASSRRRGARAFDLATVAVVPYVSVDVATRVVVALTGIRLPRVASDVLGVFALGWTVVWVGLAVVVARRGEPPPAEVAS